MYFTFVIAGTLAHTIPPSVIARALARGNPVHPSLYFITFSPSRPSSSLLLLHPYYLFNPIPTITRSFLLYFLNKKVPKN